MVKFYMLSLKGTSLWDTPRINNLSFQYVQKNFYVGDPHLFSFWEYFCSSGALEFSYYRGKMQILTSLLHENTVQVGAVSEMSQHP